MYMVAAYVTGLVVLVIHARLFQVTREAHSSYFPRLQRLLRHPTSTVMTISVYVVLSYFQLLVHRSMFGGEVGRMWLYPEGYYGPPQLNPSWLAVWVFATVIGVSYALQLIMEERFQLAFPAIEQGRIYTLKDRLPSSFSYAFGFVSGSIWRFWLGYFVFGWGLYRSVCGVLAHLISTSSYAVGSPLFSVGGIVVWLHSGMLVVLTWEFAHQLFEIIVTEPTHINELSLDRNLCLVNGLKHTDSQLIQHLAYQELYRLVAYNSEQRAEILADIDRASGAMWTQISGQCIGVIKVATEQLQSQAPPEKKKTPPAAHNSALPATATLKAGGAPMKDILQQSRKMPQTNTSEPLTKTGISAKSDLFGVEAHGLEKYVLTALREMLLQSALGQRLLLRSRRAKSISTFTNFQQQVWAIRTLMRMVECSIVDDKYGVVQGDIGMILKVIFTYLKELERISTQVDGGRGACGYNVQVTSRQTVAMIQVLRNALYSFTTSFYEYLEALKLPPAQAQALQLFADFQA
ncbi:hypothetical protein COEREDRAFT_84930 [Coemansia reversa NRRL 1564]|uniref:Nucleoporin protein Ndc1-Nup n=1 Tax=Coemansia reversa (strain ATCC 12441 / NRRL 1564) TaxID=763665 RepID=A0A2G5BJ11_COERN|nr:hypothetical protein COEREDRAFT_84930 [Coemansia reversa NRRL 1564]|eukprot:PIA18993.1 hypothetical protein COEREDRAFT_84930 [Coemansia reversa NRRL 1564]